MAQTWGSRQRESCSLLGTKEEVAQGSNEEVAHGANEEVAHGANEEVAKRATKGGKS
jgi:hypothetical protein